MSNYEILRSGTAAVGSYVRDHLELDGDFGTVAVGQRADLVLLGSNPVEDVANLAVHLELRLLQAGRGAGSYSHRGLTEGLYRAYARRRPLDVDLLSCHERRTWFRLACLYRFRARSRHLVPSLLTRVVGERPRSDQF